MHCMTHFIKLCPFSYGICNYRGVWTFTYGNRVYDNDIDRFCKCKCFLFCTVCFGLWRYYHLTTIVPEQLKSLGLKSDILVKGTQRLAL